MFFGDIADKQQLHFFRHKLISKNNSYFQELFSEITREIDEEHNFVLHTKLGYFKTVELARDYFNQQTDSTDPIRLASREWNQQNQILSKAEIIDVRTGKPLQILNCLENICERFGGTCDEQNGCSTVTFAKEYQNKKQFPIKVVVG